MNRKIKILHVLDSLGVGGMENGVVNIVNLLDADLFESHILCLTAGGLFQERISGDRVKVQVMNFNGGVRYSHIKQISTYLRNNELDIVHTHNFAPGLKGIFAARMAGTPVIIHGEHGLIQNENSFRRELLSSVIALFAHRHVYVSEGLRNYCVSKLKYQRTKASVIINGVDSLRFSPGQGNLELGKLLGITGGGPVIGSVGRFVEFKNHSLLIRVLPRLREKFPDLRAVFVGDGPRKEYLLDLVGQLNIGEHVVFTGIRADVEKIYPLFDVFVLSSLVGEGTSNVLLEAMMSGLPVVASNVVGNDKLITDGVNGYLFESDSEAGLYEKLVLLLSDAGERRKIADRSRAYAEEHFSLQAMVKKYENLYLDLYEKSNRS